MVQFGGEIVTLASFERDNIVTRGNDLKSLPIRTKTSRKVFIKCLAWARLDSGYSTEHRWKAMGTLVAFSRFFGTHMQLIENQRFDFILSLALAFFPAFQPSVLLHVVGRGFRNHFKLNKRSVGPIIMDESALHRFYAPGAGLFAIINQF